MPEISARRLESICGERLTPRQFPEVFITLLDDKIVGTASIVDRDISIGMDLSPWLATVSIKTDCRGVGFGSQFGQTLKFEAVF